MLRKIRPRGARRAAEWKGAAALDLSVAVDGEARPGGGNVSKAARVLGLRRQSLQRKLKKYSAP